MSNKQETKRKVNKTNQSYPEEEVHDAIPICCCCISLIMLIIIIISFATPNAVPLPFGYQLLMIFIVFSIALAIIWNYTCSYHYDSLVCDIGWEKVPQWAVFSLSLSASFAVLIFLGFTSYTSDVYFSIGVMITWTILFVLTLIIGLFGVYDFQSKPGAAVLHAVGNLINFIIHTVDIITDVIAAMNVYQAKDYKFWLKYSSVTV